MGDEDVDVPGVIGDVNITSDVEAFDDEDFDLQFDVNDFISDGFLPVPLSQTLPQFVSSVPYGPTTLPTDADEGVKPSFWLKQFWTPEMTDKIVRQTNLYQAQQTEEAGTSSTGRPWSTLTVARFEEYLAVRIVLGLIRLPSYTWAWADSEICGNDFCKNVMSLMEFEQITRYLHCSNNTRDRARGQPGHDPLYKVRPVLDALRENCLRGFGMGRELSMDEEDLGFQGQHPDKERITYKSAGDGFLVYSVCDAASAYTHDFRPKMCTRWDKRMGGFTPTFAAVLCLLQTLEGKWHHVFVDNLYGNLKLAEECLLRKILWTSTMREQRIPASLKLTPKGPKGEVAQQKVGNVLVLKWRDRNEVKFATTAHLAVEKVDTVRRRPRHVNGQLQWMNVAEEVLNVSKYYNHFKNGVDVADQLRSRKWWHTFFFWAFDTAICNAFICYKVWWKNAGMQGKHLSQADFRRALSYHLAKFRPNISPAKAAREATIQASQVGPRVRVKGHHPRILGRSAKNGHLLYRTCAWCNFQARKDPTWKSDQKRPMSSWGCPECNVALCVECFAPFHSQ